MRIERLHLKKLNNTRDLGGFPTKDGKKIRSGKLIRSSKLYKLPKETVAALLKLGVTTVVDFRTERERMERPYCELPGVKYVTIPLLCMATRGITHEKSMASNIQEDSKRIKSEFGTADNYMAYVYDQMLFYEESCKLLSEFIKLVINEDGCVLWYCNQGKDRTGIAAMLLEWLLGVDEKLIVEDYTITDKFRRRKNRLQKLGLAMVPGKVQFKALLRAMMDAKPQYITEAMNEIKKRCGSVESYAEQYLKITEQDIKKLKAKYLE